MEKEEFEIEEIIPMNIIKDQKQMRVAIPSDIVEKFRIDPKRHQFGWIIEKSKKNKVIITGKFLYKQNEKKKNSSN